MSEQKKVEPRSKYRCPLCYGSDLSVQVKGWCHVAVGQTDQREGVINGPIGLDGVDSTQPQDVYDEESQMLCHNCDASLPTREFKLRGWEIFESGRGTEIQRVDEDDVFDSDVDAFAYICSNRNAAAECINELLEIINRERAPKAQERKV